MSSQKLKTALGIYRKHGVLGIAETMIHKMRGDAGVDENTTIDISDAYTKWLSFANAGMLDPGNLYCFDYAISNLPSSDPIIEIGSFCGLSTNIITYYKQKYGVNNRLITCDKWAFEGEKGSDRISEHISVSHREYRDFVRDNFLRNVKMFSRDDLPFTVETISDDFFNAWKNSEETVDVFGRAVRLGGPISFCYIDGNHSYEFAKRDFENCDLYLTPGGFILFDDSADGSGWDVCKVVKEVQLAGKYDLVVKNPNYLFRKKGDRI